MTPVLHEHPFAAYCWKALIAFYECDVAFERVFVGDAADRQRLATLWPVGSIPVLVDGERVLGESTTIVEHMAPELVPGLDARLWDRVIDGQVMTPMQKIVADSLRPEDARDPYGVEEARGTLERAYALLEQQICDEWLAGPSFSIADCAAAPALFYARVVHRWDEAGVAPSHGLLLAPDRAGFGGPGDRGGAPVPGRLPAPLAGLRGLTQDRHSTPLAPRDRDRAARPRHVGAAVAGEHDHAVVHGAAAAGDRAEPVARAAARQRRDRAPA